MYSETTRLYDENSMPQGSELWLKFRRKYGTASEAASSCEVRGTAV